MPSSLFSLRLLPLFQTRARESDDPRALQTLRQRNEATKKGNGRVPRGGGRSGKISPAANKAAVRGESLSSGGASWVAAQAADTAHRMGISCISLTGTQIECTWVQSICMQAARQLCGEPAHTVYLCSKWWLPRISPTSADGKYLVLQAVTARKHATGPACDQTLGALPPSVRAALPDLIEPKPVVGCQSPCCFGGLAVGDSRLSRRGRGPVKNRHSTGIAGGRSY